MQQDGVPHSSFEKYSVLTAKNESGHIATATPKGFIYLGFFPGVHDFDAKAELDYS